MLQLIAVSATVLSLGGYLCPASADTIADRSPLIGGVDWTIQDGKTSWRKGDESAFVRGTFGTATASGYYTPNGESPSKMAESYDGPLTGSGFWILNSDGSYRITMAEIAGSSWGPTPTNGTFVLSTGCEQGVEKRFSLFAAQATISIQGQTLIPISGTVITTNSDGIADWFSHTFGIFAPSFHCQIPFGSLKNLPRTEQLSGSGRICTDSNDGSSSGTHAVMGTFSGSDWGPLFCAGSYTTVPVQTYNGLLNQG